MCVLFEIGDDRLHTPGELVGLGGACFSWKSGVVRELGSEGKSNKPEIVL